MPVMESVSLLQEDNTCVGAAAESRSAGHRSNGGLREREGEQCKTRIVSAEKKVYTAGLHSELLMTTLNE